MLLFESLLKYGHVIEAHAQGLLHEGAVACDVALDARLHHLVKRHLNDCRNGFQTLDVFFIGHVASGAILDILVENGVVLQIPVVHHLLGVGLKTFGIDDGGIGDGLFEREY